MPNDAPHPPECWPLSRCEDALWEAACRVLLLREDLEVLKTLLPIPPDLHERLAGRLPHDRLSEIYVAIETVIEDYLAPAQERLAEMAEPRLQHPVLAEAAQCEP
jgi:hypothetical protein